MNKIKLITFLLSTLILIFIMSVSASDVCNCRGYADPGGPCYDGPGGAAYSGPGGPAYDGPGGPCYDGPGGTSKLCPAICK